MTPKDNIEDMTQYAKDALADGKETAKDAWVDTKAAAEKTRNAIESEKEKL
ncbi:MAG: hypothetical protein ACYC6X_03355 [Minisyncoccota bacterium]